MSATVNRVDRERISVQAHITEPIKHKAETLLVNQTKLPPGIVHDPKQREQSALMMHAMPSEHNNNESVLVKCAN